jgi:hypothetical protein
MHEGMYKPIFLFYTKNLFLNWNLCDSLGKGQAVAVKRITSPLKLVLVSMEKVE